MFCVILIHDFMMTSLVKMKGFEMSEKRLGEEYEMTGRRLCGDFEITIRITLINNFLMIGLLKIKDCYIAKR